ncbi:MAG: Rv3654c family TadE-like protein [Terracoccus sp.]
MTEKSIALRSRRDRGAGTVLAVTMTWALLTVTLAALVLGSAVLASHRARLAADLAALAAASQTQTGGSTGQACAEAGRVAALNGAALSSCSVEGSDVLLVVSVDVGVTGQATARSRAGPPR